MRLLGRVFDKEDKADEFIDYYRQQISQVRNVVSLLDSDEKPLVFLENAPGWSANYCCSTFGSAHFGRVIEEAGGVNLGSRKFTGYGGEVSLESVIADDPEVIIGTGANWAEDRPEVTSVLVGYEADSKVVQSKLAGLANRKGFNTTRAVKDKRFYSIYHQFYNRPYRFIAVQVFAKWLHPDEFPDLDPDANFIEFHQLFLPFDYSGIFLGRTKIMPEKIRMQASDSTGKSYRSVSARRKRLLLILLVLLVVSVLFDVMLGPSNLSWGQLLTTISLPDNAGVKAQVIVWDLRFPIALMAVLEGAMLGAAGAGMQTILNNPLADPFTLGISSAASFGAAVAIVLQINLIPFAGEFLVTVNAFVLALSTSLILYLFTRMRGVNSETMVLVGIAMMLSFNALLALMQYGASEIELAQIVFWMMGSLARATWDKVLICCMVLVIVLPFFMSRNWSLTTLRMGDDKAASLGVNVKRLRIEILIVISLLAATAVSFVGTVAFVGLVGPHIARLLVGEDQRYFLPSAIFAGALMMSLTSIISKTINPGVIYPIGMITSLIGIPFFISLIMTVRRRSWQ